MKTQKTKRIKRVFSNGRMVLHLWANQSQDSARSSNVFFQGKSCYSYGYHYELGRLVQYNGVTVAMINGAGYSNTTAKHILWAQGAASHMVTLKATSSSELNNVKKALLEEQGFIVDQLFKHFSSRSFWSEEQWREDSWLASQVKDFNEKATKLKHKDLCLNVTQDFIDLYNEHIKLALQREKELEEKFNSPEEVKRREEKKQREEAKRIEDHKAKIEEAKKELDQWLNNEKSSIGYSVQSLLGLNTQLIRVTGEEVQTTGGASVPLSHALRLLRLIESGKAKSGDRIGHFTFNELDNGIVRIGCHRISLTEAQKVLEPYKTKLTIVENEEQFKQV